MKTDEEKPKKDVLCIGSALADITSWPVETQELVRHHVRAEQTGIGPGGCAGNVSIGLAALGKDVSLLARLGNDGSGSLVGNLFRERGVDTRHLVLDQANPTGITLVLVDRSGERRFIYTPGANARLCPADLEAISFSSFRLLHISDIFLLPELEGQAMVPFLVSAREAGLTTSMDTVWDSSGRWMDLLEPCIPYLNFLFVSEEEACHLLPGLGSNEVVTRLLELGAETVILKLGAKGSLVARGLERVSIQARDITPRDTTGAGDAYVAAFLAAVLEGLELTQAASLASRFAEQTIRHMGATSGMERHASVAEFAKTMGS